jgi:N-dimethylarginine dimethylaminohydrolase
MYSVHQHWDPLKVCAVGKSYSPKFYDYIKNSKIRDVFYQIAEETEQDYQKLIKLLESFNVEVLRPEITDDPSDYLKYNNQIERPPMTPRDYTAMIGSTFYIPEHCPDSIWHQLAGSDWPLCPQTKEEFNSLPNSVYLELQKFEKSSYFHWKKDPWEILSETVKNQNNQIIYNNSNHLVLNSAMIVRIGKDLYFGTESCTDNLIELNERYSNMFPEYRCHVINTDGHSDGVFCAVVPGLIISHNDISTYKDPFPDWEVIYPSNQCLKDDSSFLSFKKLREKNSGKWWVPGEELNDDFTNFVESWMNHWVGYVEETAFDVNLLVIDEKNVVCTNYNQEVFNAFSRYGITPHIVNFRHRYFWDGGLHCITSDIHREGTMQDYFPNRG